VRRPGRAVSPSVFLLSARGPSSFRFCWSRRRLYAHGGAVFFRPSSFPRRGGAPPPLPNSLRFSAGTGQASPPPYTCKQFRLFGIRLAGYMSPPPLQRRSGVPSFSVRSDVLRCLVSHPLSDACLRGYRPLTSLAFGTAHVGRPGPLRILRESFNAGPHFCVRARPGACQTVLFDFAALEVLEASFGPRRGVSGPFLGPRPSSCCRSALTFVFPCRLVVFIPTGPGRRFFLSTAPSPLAAPRSA